MVNKETSPLYTRGAGKEYVHSQSGYFKGFFSVGNLGYTTAVPNRKGMLVLDAGLFLNRLQPGSSRWNKAV